MRVLLWVVTLLRIALIPLFVFLAETAQELGRAGLDPTTYRWAALTTIFVMGVTDLLDGWIARRFDLATQVGATVDAVADKLVQVALVAFFTLSVGPVFTPLPLWFLIAIFGRDLVLLVGVSVLRVRYGPLHVKHRQHGKIASMLVFLVLFWVSVRAPTVVLMPLLVVTTAMSLVTATLYSLDGARQGRQIAAG